MADLRTTDRTSRDAWIRGHVLTRFFAAVWWVVMVAITLVVTGSWTQLVIERSWRAVITAAIATLVFIPVGREWPNASRMGRMLRHGT